MDKKPSKLLAVGYLLVGGGFIAESLAMFSSLRGDADPVAPLRGGKMGNLGKPASRSQAAAQGVPLKKHFENAPSIEAREKIIHRLINKGSENTTIRKAALSVLTRKCGAEGSRTWCVPEKNWNAEVRALWTSITDPNSPFAVRYTLDHAEIDTYTAADKTLLLRGEDCDGQTIYLGAMLRAVGYPVGTRIIQQKGRDTWSHIYLIVGLPPQKPAKWVALDTTMKQKGPGWEAPDEWVVRRRDKIVGG